MPFETMHTLDLSTDERIDYYADDVEAAADALDDVRNDISNREFDGKLRVIILALETIAHSLELEAEEIRKKTRR